MKLKYNIKMNIQIKIALVILAKCSIIQFADGQDKSDNVIKLIRDSGYPAESYKVMTDDRYILMLHRIPNYSGYPVFLFPGLLSSAADFVTIGTNKSLGFILHDLGFDVWLGNARGTTFSREHRTLNPDTDKEYWNFSWHEIGVHDVSSFIDVVLEITKHDSLFYIGHSQGCSSLLVLLSENPDYNKKINAAHFMAPAVHMGNTRSPILRTVASLNPWLQKHSKDLGIYEFYPKNSTVSILWKHSCNNINELLSRTFCTNFIFLLGGANDAQFNYGHIKNISENYPAGTSVKQLDHFSQLVYSKKFTKYDYGRSENLKLYNSEFPPEYSWHNMNCTVFIYYASNDILTVPEDVITTAKKLKNVAEVYNIPDQMFTHTNFLWAKDAHNLVYQKLSNNLLSNLYFDAID